MSPIPAAPLRCLWPRLAPWLPSRRALLWALAAFGVGLRLSLLIWRDEVDDPFYRAGSEPTVAPPSYAPLPAPVTGGAEEGGDLAAPPASDGNSLERPRLVETSPPPPPATTRTAPPPEPTQGVASQP